MCLDAKKNSHDPDRQVGAVLVSELGDFLSSGTNAPVTALGMDIDASHRKIEQDPDWKYLALEHAERNAISAAHSKCRKTQGATMYVTLHPCADCARAIIAAGIKKLVLVDAPEATERDDRWAKHYTAAKEMLAQAKIDTSQLSTIEK